MFQNVQSRHCLLSFVCVHLVSTVAVRAAHRECSSASITRLLTERPHHDACFSSQASPTACVRDSRDPLYTLRSSRQFQSDVECLHHHVQSSWHARDTAWQGTRPWDSRTASSLSKPAREYTCKSTVRCVTHGQPAYQNAPQDSK